jgi:hypothetical protein
MSQTTEKSKHQEQYETKIKDLSEYRTDEEKRLKQQNSAAREAASISHQKLMKYLPQQTAWYSVGMTETAKIAANNSLQRQLAEADAAYEGSMADLKRYVAAEEDAAADKLYEREQDAAAKQAAAYNEMMNMMRNGEYGVTTDDLREYLFGNSTAKSTDESFGEADLKGDFTEMQKQNLLAMYNSIANDPDKIKADNPTLEAYEDYDDLVAAIRRACLLPSGTTEK